MTNRVLWKLCHSGKDRDKPLAKGTQGFNGFLRETKVSEKQKLQKFMNFSFSKDAVLITYHICETIEVSGFFFSFLAVFILELAIFKVTVPAKGGNCISRVPGIKQRKEKGTEKVAAFTQRAQMFCFLPCSVCSKKKKKEFYSKH